jgi:hypothetical protein
LGYDSVWPLNQPQTKARVIGSVRNNYRLNAEISAKCLNTAETTTNAFIQKTYRDWTRIPRFEIITTNGEVEASGFLTIEWKAKRYQISQSDLDGKCSPV